jgi:hypothetical protein
MLLSETKLDPALRVRVDDLETHGESADLLIEGKCATPINGPMRSSLVRAGADISVMKGDRFEATIPSGDLFDVAALEFVTYLKLLNE